MNPAIAAVLTKATALGAKYGPKAAAAATKLGQQATAAATKLGSTQVGQQATAAATKLGQQAVATGKKTVMAGQKLGSYFASPEAFKAGATQLGEKAVKAATSEGVQQAGKRAIRDTLLYSAAEQVIPRALGAEAPSIRDTLVRQATGNIIAEGATAGLQKAFPMGKGSGLLDASGRAMKPQREGLFGLPGIKPGDARKIGEVTGQIGGQAIAQTILPGRQDNPFLPTTYMQEEDYLQIGDGPKMTRSQLEQTTEGKALLKAAELSQITNEPVSYERPQSLGSGPTTPTGATKFTAEPEFNEVVRPSTTDLSGVQAREALSERERYEYRLKLAQIEKMPSPVMHMSPDSNMQSLNSLAQSMMRQASY